MLRFLRQQINSNLHLELFKNKLFFSLPHDGYFNYYYINIGTKRNLIALKSFKDYFIL